MFVKVECTIYLQYIPDFFLIYIVVHKVKTQTGSKANITLETNFLSYYLSSTYYVFHVYKGYYRNIFSITTDGVDYGGENKSTKYTYLGRFSNIVFEIGDITLDDAGYYNGGSSAEAVRSAEGAVLIVSGMLPSHSTLIQKSLFKLWGLWEMLTGS